MESYRETIPQQSSNLPDYRRLYGAYNRGVINKMRGLQMEVVEEPYNTNEVLRYLTDSGAREANQLSDRNAMKAHLFAEWLTAQGVALPERQPTDPHTSAPPLFL